jgi:hypothetical protein
VIVDYRTSYAFDLRHNSTFMNGTNDGVTAQLPTDGGLVLIQHLGHMILIVSVFHEDVNLIAFGFAEVFVGHKQIRLPCNEALIAKHPQPLSHQLIKVALHA